MSRSCLMIVDPGLQLWGSERALAATLNALTDAWDRVVLITPAGAALAELAGDRAQHGPVEIHFAPIGFLNKKGRWARLAAMLRLAILVARHRPDRLYLNQAGLCRLMLPIARLARIPFVIHVRLLEDVARVAPLRGRPGAPLHKVFISDAMLAAQAPWVDACTSVDKAYDPYCFEASDREGSGDAASFVCVGRLSHSKGQHLLVEALASPGVETVQVDFFGEGVDGEDYTARLVSRADELSLADRIVFQGFSQNVAARLGGYRFLVSTSKYETLGRVVMEAWDAGLVPIVYANSGGAAEIVRKSGGGLLYEDWTPSSLAEAIRRAMVMSDAERRAVALEGLKWGKANLGIDQYKARLKTALFTAKAQGKS